MKHACVVMYTYKECVKLYKSVGHNYNGVKLCDWIFENRPNCHTYSVYCSMQIAITIHSQLVCFSSPMFADSVKSILKQQAS